jgi:transcription termination factor Rho
MDITNATEAIIQRLAETDNNMEFLERLTEEQV